MNGPLVSICLPNLNTFSFLQKRLDTILGQSYKNWELIVVDSYSNDGSWELFEKLAAEDKRVSIHQAPRGLYESWNRCIERACGEYVYIATSDDTMALDCLEKMVAALEESPDCDLAHCNLHVIDEAGHPASDPQWPDCSSFAAEDRELIHRKHIRRAPYDGLLHLTGRSVYVSLTELLIRRRLFSKIGGFPTKWGSVGDFNWSMKAGLVASTVHVPDTWASFRIRASQATGSVNFWSEEHFRKIAEMIQDAVEATKPHLDADVVSGLMDHWLEWSNEMRAYDKGLRDRRDSTSRRRFFQIAQIMQGKKSVRTEVVHALQGETKWAGRVPQEIRHWLESVEQKAMIESSVRYSGE